MESEIVRLWSTKKQDPPRAKSPGWGTRRKTPDRFAVPGGPPVVYQDVVPGGSARLGLARAYALDAAKDSAARDKARAAYQDFLTLWKDADPDIPIYKQAKAE
ncbi:MAG TPA: hypothetical protein VII29_13835 [Terriglobales bacterium]